MDPSRHMQEISIAKMRRTYIVAGHGFRVVIGVKYAPSVLRVLWAESRTNMELKCECRRVSLSGPHACATARRAHRCERLAST